MALCSQSTFGSALVYGPYTAPAPLRPGGQIVHPLAVDITRTPSIRRLPRHVSRPRGVTVSNLSCINIIPKINPTALINNVMCSDLKTA